MAIGKSMTGKGFGGTARYILEKVDAQFLCASGVVTEDPTLIAKQMRAVADIRNLKNPVMHFTISLEPPARGTDEQWKKAIEAFLEDMGFDLEQTQYMAARHSDTKHDHVHILANRVQLNNTLVNDFQHKRRAFEATRAAELAAGFKPFESKKERGIKIQETRDKIDSALRSSKNLLGAARYDKFKSELSKLGVEIVENRSKTSGRLYGVSYKTETHSFKGSSLGKAYSLSGLQKQGLKIEQFKPLTQQRASTHTHDPSKSTQSRVDAEKAKRQGHTNTAKASAQADENKRLQAIRTKEHENEEEME